MQLICFTNLSNIENCDDNKMRKIRDSLLSILVLSIIFLLAGQFYVPSASAQSTVGSWTHIGLNNLTVGTLVSDPTNASKLYAGTSDGVYQSTDGGSTWTAGANQGTPALVVVISPSDHNILYATLENTGIQKSTDGGNTWTDVTNNFGTPGVILDLAISPTDSNTVIAAPYGNCLGIRKTTDGGATWNGVGGGCDLYRISYDPTDPNTIYAGGTNFSGYVAKSIDGGNSWITGSDPNHIGNDGSSGAVRGIAIDANNSNQVYAGQEISGVYKTTDGGSNWNLLPNSPSVSIGNGLAISPMDSSIYARSSNGVSTSADGGNAWTAINTGDTPTGIQKLIILPNDPYNLYAATDTGVYVYGLQTPQPVTETFNSAGDTYIRNGEQNRNLGAGLFMKLQSSGSNRSIVKFDQATLQSTIGSHQVLSAKLRLNITDNGNNWGATGRTIDVHRLLSDWVEGNGTENNRGTGSGVTWNCAIDSNIVNQNDDCSGQTAWNMNNTSLWPFASAVTATTTIINNQSGAVEFDVTSDVQSFMSGSNQNYGWIIKKTNEGQAGQVSFGTKESTSVPQLVVTYQP